MRYIDEIPNIVEVTANDISPQACAVMHEGIEYNSIDKSKISVTNGDAVFAMHKRRNDGLSYDVVDIDPYGSAVPFLDAAVQTVAGDGGLLCITCTDTSVLCGVFPETSLPRYGTVAFKAGYKHEMALRMLLHAVDSAANRYKRYIVPLVSVSLDFYVRVFVRVYESQVDVKRTLEKRLMLYQSTQCPTFHTQAMGKVWPTKRGVEGSTTSYQVTRLSVPPTCASGGQWKVGGPFWGAALHDQSFVESLLRNVEAARIAQSNDASVKASKTVVKPPARTVATAERLAGVLSSISEELKDVPFYYCLTDLSAALQCNTPTQVEFRSALINAGYKVSRFHSEPDAIKTNAPSDVVRTQFVLPPQ
jgi:tRNA (guanine26-N2/guanine27-N2)-dimethyltransferase